MTERQSSNRGLDDGVRVRTSRDGRKYVDPNELVRTKKAQEQLKSVRRWLRSGQAS